VAKLVFGDEIGDLDFQVTARERAGLTRRDLLANSQLGSPSFVGGRSGFLQLGVGVLDGEEQLAELHLAEARALWCDHRFQAVSDDEMRAGR
jgi:hypothetical protein